ncbi:MAG: ImmA/IrrE family metallo-endopeptidase [Desulfovibrionaceae bacterium]|nr:ImmA/IrrE family metallo-endopeptidase [Desulfovibrionaceae bacterium]
MQDMGDYSSNNENLEKKVESSNDQKEILIMPGISVHVHSSILHWAMQKAKKENASKSVLEMIATWISGKKTPTFDQIKDVSNKINIPFGYFFLEQPPVEKCKIVEFRTIDSIYLQDPSRNLIDTVDCMLNIQEWMADYNINNDLSEYSFVVSIEISDSILLTANRIREKLELSIDWFDQYNTAEQAYRYLRNSITNLGILVMMNDIVGNNTHRTLNVEEFRAFTLVNTYAPLIFINSRDTNNGKLFSLLHELIHIWIGVDNLYNDTYGSSQIVSKEEQFCNAVAYEILVPDSFFSEEWSKQSGDNEHLITKLSKRFMCSRFVLLKKALDNGKINQNEFERLLRLFKSQIMVLKDQKQNETSGGYFYRTLVTKLDKNFIQALYTSAQSGKIPYRDVYRMTNTNGKTFHGLVEKVRSI